MKKSQLQKYIYDTALKALDKSELKDTILKYSNLDKRIKYILVQTAKDMRTLWRLRKKVFVDEEGYPLKSTRNVLDRGAIHFLAKKDNIAVGSISVYLNSITGLPIEKILNVNLGIYKKEKMAEIEKLAVLPDYRKTTISLGLMVVAYEFIKLCEVERICIFTLSSKKENLAIYKRFGFRKILEFMIFDSKKATCMVLDITSDSFYEKTILLNLRRANLAKQLAKMLSFNI
jgi:predicted GNAT family N-acyltransferase